MIGFILSKMKYNTCLTNQTIKNNILECILSDCLYLSNPLTLDANFLIMSLMMNMISCI